MSNKYKCPYCEVIFVLSRETESRLKTSFDIKNIDNVHYQLDNIQEESIVQLNYFHCPNCKEYSVEILGIGEKVSKINYRILPFGKAKEFPEYVPKAIREDYEEACLIKDLSPKSSATLSRRCLQGMIRDFWKIKEANLSRAINALEGKIPPNQWKVIHAVREIGNIGAHMEKDIDKIVNIDPLEADKLIELIEFLINKWYIDSHETELLFSDITEMNNEKQKERKK